jgi:hypothetical protein
MERVHGRVPRDGGKLGGWWRAENASEPMNVFTAAQRICARRGLWLKMTLRCGGAGAVSGWIWRQAAGPPARLALRG